MRKIAIIFTFFILLYAQTQSLSPLPLPSTYFIDLDIYPCDTYCLQNDLENERIFSFLSHAKEVSPLPQPYKKIYALYSQLFQIPSMSIFSITLLYDKRLRNLLPSLTQNISSYFLIRQALFSLKTQMLESNVTLQDHIDQAQKSDLIIYLATFNDINDTQPNTSTPLFIPTLHAKFLHWNGENVYFGGIDYQKQIDLLYTLHQGKTAIFYLKNAALSKSLTDYIVSKYGATSLYDIGANATNLKGILKDNEDLNQSAIILNTPPIQSALILSQCTFYDIVPQKKLSTQINFSPSILSMTQQEDKRNLFVATIAMHYPPLLEGAIATMENIPTYDWLNYATLVGIDYFFSKKDGKNALFQKSFDKNQIQYPLTIKEAKSFSFQDSEKFLENREESSQSFDDAYKQALPMRQK